jgi:hypothetical protein
MIEWGKRAGNHVICSGAGTGVEGMCIACCGIPQTQINTDISSVAFLDQAFDKRGLCMWTSFAFSSVYTVIAGWLLTRREEVACHCHANLDRKLLEIIEVQLGRCGPEKLQPECQACVCECRNAGEECSPRFGHSVLLLVLAFGIAIGIFIGIYISKRVAPSTSPSAIKKGGSVEEAKPVRSAPSGGPSSPARLRDERHAGHQ